MYLKYSRSLKQNKSLRELLQRKIKGDKGFTLAEFFIAITIFSFIALALFTSLNTSLKVYKQESKMESTFSGIQMISTLMERELQNAVYLNNIALIGTADQMYFHAPSAFFGSDYPVNKVTYAVINDENESTFLKKTSENAFLDEMTEEEFQGSTYFYDPENFVSNIQFKYLSFHLEEAEGEEESSEPEIVWQSSWEEEFFPDAVKIEYSFLDNESMSSYESIIVLPGTWKNIVSQEE